MIEEYKGYKLTVERDCAGYAVVGAIEKDNFRCAIRRECPKTKTIVIHSYSNLFGLSEDTHENIHYEEEQALLELRQELKLCVDIIEVRVKKEVERILKEKEKMKALVKNTRIRRFDEIKQENTND